ncbi:MAG: ribose 5-phosphate isomerase B [Desulfovibrionaceae bacterium]|nr:ribose 5-phosphate isomerase B [Desulfovibrionaceae bacterium]
MFDIAIGSDHAGYDLKQEIIAELKAQNCRVLDVGTDSAAVSCDYPDFAAGVCEHVLKTGGLGILVCGTGIGMSMAANKYEGIRAALCTSEFQGRMTRRHNNANVLCLGARVTGRDLALAIVREFLEAEFEGGRHLTRIQKFARP